MKQMEIRWIALAFAAFVGLAGNAVAGEDAWTGELSASLTAQTGTNDTIAGAIDAVTERTWEKDEVSGRFSASYGTTRSRPNGDEEVTQNAQGLFGDWKRTIHERFFWASDAELSRDTVQDRSARAAIGTGPGYRFWEGEDRPKEHFDLRTGLGYRFELYDLSTAPGDPDRGQYDEDHYVDVILAFEYKNMLFEDRLEFTHTGSAKMPANDPNAFVLATEVILGVPLTQAWSLRASFLAEYQNVQPEQVNNTLTRTTIGLGYKF